MSDNDNIIPIPPQFAALGITEGDSVVIPRAQHEALMAAAGELDASSKDMPYPPRRETREALAALRAAGIDPSEDPRDGNR